MSLAEDIREPEVDAPQRIIIPYVPRKHFKPLHASPKRFKFVVAHRRAGKSVAEINEMIKRALTINRPNMENAPPRYAYVGPSFAQTKDLIWGYLKHYTRVFAGMPGYKVSEGDLQVTLPNGAMINLYGGAAAYERMRGLYFDGIVLDEFPLLNPSVLSTVVRPCLADYRGWCIVSGTSNGDDHFHELKKRAEEEIRKSGERANWDIFIIPVTETDALDPDEVIEMTSDMSPEEYAREMLCAFDAPIEGAYFADLMNKAEADGRVQAVPHQPEQPVWTWWDLGIDDYMCVWFVQRAGGELHVIDYVEVQGLGIPQIWPYITGKPVPDRPTQNEHFHRAHYNFAGHIPPHDIAARELGTGKSREEIMQNLAGTVPVLKAPSLSVEDGIQAVRAVLPICRFDKERTVQGRSALRNYHKSKTGRPVHNWASHGTDAFRSGAVSIQLMGGWSSGNVVSMGSGRFKRRIRGLR